MRSVRKKARKRAKNAPTKTPTKTPRPPKVTVLRWTDDGKPLIVRYGTGKIPWDIIRTKGPDCPGASDALLEDRASGL